MDQNWQNSFKEKLDQHHAWPSVYVFKFIVPVGKEQEVKQLFLRHDTIEKASKNGNYVSVTAQMMMFSSESVIEIYIKAAEIEGLIAL